VRECFFHFSADSVRNLKAKVNAEMAGTATATISSLQSLLAHLWCAVCRARMFPPHRHTTYMFLVGCRERMRGVPQGNAVTQGCASSIVGEVEAKGLGWAAEEPSFIYVEASLGDSKVVTGSSLCRSYSTPPSAYKVLELGERHCYGVAVDIRAAPWDLSRCMSCRPLTHDVSHVSSLSIFPRAATRPAIRMWQRRKNVAPSDLAWPPERVGLACFSRPSPGLRAK
jgi:hypothetical protein